MARTSWRWSLVAAVSLASLCGVSPAGAGDGADVEIQLPGAERARYLLSEPREVIPDDPPFTLSGGDRERLVAVWAWSATCPVTRADADELSRFRCPDEVEWVRVRLSWPGAPRTEPPAGVLYAAPVAAWSQVPEPLLPVWPVDGHGVARVPVPRRDTPIRVRFAGDELASPWVDVTAGSGEVGVAVEPAARPAFQVLGPDGGPSPAAVTLFEPRVRSDVHRAFLISDETGVVRPAGMPAELEVAVVASSPGGLPVKFTGLVRHLPPELRIQPACEVTGRVENREEEPLPWVQVRGEGYLGGGDGLLLWTEATSGADGGYSLASLPTGPAVVAFDGEGLGRKTVRVNLADCDRSHDLGVTVLRAARTLEVRVLDDLGVPVANAEVRTGSGETAFTDADGTAHLEQVTEGEGFDLTVDGEGYLERQRMVPPPLPEALELELQRAAMVRGRLIDGSGEPVADAEVRLQRQQYFRDRPAAADGTFSVELVPDRRQELRFRSPSTVEVVRRLEPIAAGAEVDLGDVALPAGWAITGRLLRGDTAEPVAGAAVWALRSGVSGGPLSAWLFDAKVSTHSDTEGEFRLSGLEAGPATVRIESPGLAPREIDVAPEEEAPEPLDVGDVELAPGATVHVTGRATEPAVARLDWKREWREMDMLTAPYLDGEAWMRHAPAGPAILSVVRRGEQLCEAEVVVPEEGTLEVDCEEGALQVAGTVRRGGVPDGPGRLLWLSETMGDTVILNRRSALGAYESRVLGAGRPQIDVPVTAEGRFHTSAVAPGRWKVVWYPQSGGSSRPRDVELPPRGELELTLEFAPHRLTGLVVDAGGEPVEGARVVDVDGQVATRTAEDGSFQLLDLDVGTHRLQALTRTGSSAVESVEIAADRPTDPVVLTVDRPAGHTLRVVVEAEGGTADGGFAFVEVEGGGIRILTLDGQGTGELELRPPLPSRVRMAALHGGRWTFGDWQATERVVEDGLHLVGGRVGALELVGFDGDRAVEVEIVAPGGWSLTTLYRHLGSRLVMTPGRALVIAGLAAGRYRLEVGTGRQSADVEEDETARIRLDQLEVRSP